jgi:hypothetical protein
MYCTFCGTEIMLHERAVYHNGLFYHQDDTHKCYVVFLNRLIAGDDPLEDEDEDEDGSNPILGDEELNS